MKKNTFNLSLLVLSIISLCACAGHRTSSPVPAGVFLITHIDTIIKQVRITYKMKSADTLPGTPVISEIAFSKNGVTSRFLDTSFLRWGILDYTYGFENKIKMPDYEDPTLIREYSIVSFNEGFLACLWFDGYLSVAWFKPNLDVRHISGTKKTLDFETHTMTTARCDCVGAYDDAFVWINSTGGNFYFCHKKECDYENLKDDHVYCSRKIDKYSLLTYRQGTAELNHVDQRVMIEHSDNENRLMQSDSSFWISLNKLTAK